MLNLGIVTVGIVGKNKAKTKNKQIIKTLDINNILFDISIIIRFN